MSTKSSLPPSGDLLRVMRLMADVAGLKGDPIRQRQHLANGLGELIHATLGWFFIADDYAVDNRPKLRHQVLINPCDPVFMKYIAEFGVDVPVESDPYGDHILHDRSARQLWTQSRVLAHPDAAKRYAQVLPMLNAVKVTDGLSCAYRCGTDGNRVVGVSLHRQDGKRLRPAEVNLMRFALTEVESLAGRGHLVMPDQPVGMQLPPRLQQVLDLMLSAQNPKQIARQLDLSLWTVREYVTLLYKRYNVSGREELMARFITPAIPAQELCLQ